MIKSKSLADSGFITEMKDKNGDSWYHQIVLETKDKEIKRLKEEYMILQNASDEVEEEKDKEIERLNFIIKEVREYIERYLRLNLEAFDTKDLLEKILEILDKVDKGKE